MGRNKIKIMKLKPTDHIIMFYEKNDGVMEMLNDGGAQMIMKMTNCDYIFVVDHIENPDHSEVINGVVCKFLMFPTKRVTFKKVKDEEGRKFEKMAYFKADWSASL